MEEAPRVGRKPGSAGGVDDHTIDVQGIATEEQAVATQVIRVSDLKYSTVQGTVTASHPSLYGKVVLKHHRIRSGNGDAVIDSIEVDGVRCKMSIDGIHGWRMI